MSFTTMVFLVTLVIAAMVVLSGFFHGKRPARDHGEIKELREKVRDLERRIQNVETIATSREHRLNHEFEKLGKD